jgi:hypothetical protein
MYVNFLRKYKHIIEAQNTFSEGNVVSIQQKVNEPALLQDRQ